MEYMGVKEWGVMVHTWCRHYFLFFVSSLSTSSSLSPAVAAAVAAVKRKDARRQAIQL